MFYLMLFSEQTYASYKRRILLSDLEKFQKFGILFFMRLFSRSECKDYTNNFYWDFVRSVNYWFNNYSTCDTIEISRIRKSSKRNLLESITRLSKLVSRV